MATIFDKIINREIPSDILYEDDLILAFKDISPQAPNHFLVIPKEPIPSMADLKESHTSLLGHLFFKCSEIAEQQGLSKKGYRLVVNTKEYGGQSVDHLHIHILGGRKMLWPPG